MGQNLHANMEGPCRDSHCFSSIWFNRSQWRIAYYVIILVSIILSCCQITLCRVFSYHIQYKCSRLSLDMHQYTYITLNREDQYQQHGYMYVFQTSTENTWVYHGIPWQYSYKLYVWLQNALVIIPIIFVELGMLQHISAHNFHPQCTAL